MKIDLADAELETTITALSHWRSYLIMQGEDDSTVKEVLDKLRAKPEGGNRAQ